MASPRLVGSTLGGGASRATRESIMRVQSLRPELEFEVIKLILLREGYIKRLQKLLDSGKGKVDLSVVGLVDVLRDVSLEVIETIREWERSQLEYPSMIKPFIWNGVEYMIKMGDDYGFLHAFPTVTNWLGFVPTYNPFFIPPEAYDEEFKLADDAFIVFGTRPPLPVEVTKKAVKSKFIKSPYNTPILNDLNIFPELSALNRIKKDLKAESAEQASSRGDVKVSAKNSGLSDPYESFVGADTIKRAKSCWLLLNQSTYRTNTTTSLASSLSMSKAVAESSGAKLLLHTSASGLPMSSIKEEEGLNRHHGSPTAQLGSRLEEGSFEFTGGAVGVQPLQSIKESEDAFVHGPGDGSPRGLPLPPQGTGAATTAISVAGPGAADLDGSLSRISATSAFSKTRDEFSATSLGFHASLADTAVMERLPNKAMRLTTISHLSGSASLPGQQSSVHSMGSSIKSSVKTWTPHEVKLQKTVQRRGGELFVLTAAGTRGRIKAPWRKTRFQRMESDLEKIKMQHSMVGMAVEESMGKIAELAAEASVKVQAYAESLQRDGVEETKGPHKMDFETSAAATATAKMEHVNLDPKVQELIKEKQVQLHALEEMNRGIALNRELLEYQLNLFRKLVDGGNVVDIKSQRERHQLGEGEALEKDNLISMTLEDNAASMITRTMKKAFGRAIRRMIIRKMNAAALIIQGFIRRVRMQGSAFDRNAKLTVARKLQKLFRGQGARGFYQKLKMEQAVRWAGSTIQRLARGFLARQRTRRKRMFVRAVISAGQCVTLDDISPADVDVLADAIENFMRDFLYNMPMSVMSVLRGILYMFKGDDEESLIVEQQGFAEVRRFQAKDVTWFCLKQMLRRKGKFLRRLRALVGYISFPGPCALTFSKSCQIHLDDVRANVNESDFEGLDESPKRTCINLLNYIRNMKIAFDFQSEFPEWFVPATPNWYRLCLRYQYAFRSAEAGHQINLAAKSRIDEIREEYKISGRRWGHVYTAEIKIAQDLKESEAALEKVKEMYDKYIRKFESEEKSTLNLLDGLEKARVLGLEVARRDFADYIHRNGEDDDRMVAMMRLQVDKKALSLLDIRVRQLKALEMKQINLKARDFQRLMKFKLNRQLCENSGNLLGRMAVLQEVWKDFLIKIGGIQYVPDLEGKRKAIFENIRREIQELITGRRTLNEKINKGLVAQIDRCRSISHAARVERTRLYWDNPTQIEKDAEMEEDIECSKRDADLEAKQSRQAKLVKIPLGVRKPVLLIVDIRIPKGFREILVKKLELIRFKVVPGHISDPKIALPAQRILDEGYNLVVFLDRGIHATARAAFLGYFNSFIHSLVPFPRIVALDATLQLRYENWFSEFSAEIKELEAFNEQDSFKCGLMFGRLRRTALMFRWCLLHDSAEDDRLDGASVHISPAMRQLFRNDLDDFMDEVTGDREGDDALSAMSSMEKSGMVLIATISSIMGIWKAPLLMWKEKQIQEGCNAFHERIQNAPKLCEMLWLNPLPNVDVVNMKRLEQARNLAPVWRSISQLNFYRNPARYLLARWCIETMDLMDQLSLHGGGVDEKYKFLPISAVTQLRWVEDVCDPETRAEQVVGDLLEASLSESQIHDSTSEVCEYERIDSLTDISQQYFRSNMVQRRSRVFYSGSDCYVMVSLESTTQDRRHGRKGERKEVRNFVAHMNILDVITMLQPNFTELFEGRQKRYIINGPKKTHEWCELLAGWGRIEKVGKRRVFTLLRSRFLMTSSIGYLNGYLCRFEVFEERFAEVLILIHGLPGLGTVYYRGTKAEIKRLLEHCDEDEEKAKLEIMDAQAVALIFADRLTAKPSFNKNWFLDSGELQPKSLAKQIQVYLRLAGGPGRFVGRKLVKKAHSVLLIVTIFEISNPSDIYGLRVVVHELNHQQTAEYRISPLERSSLFSDDSPLVDQIMDRIRIVYTELHDPKRCLVPLDQSFRPTIDQDEIYVDGNTEYELFSGTELLELKRRAEIQEEASLQGSEESSVATPQIFKIEESFSQPSKLESLEKSGWGFYFNRLFVEQSVGNLLVSGSLDLPNKGFSFTVLDKRTLRESYRFIPFKEAVKYLDGKHDEGAFVDELKNIDQATVYNLIDELFSSLAITPVQEIDGHDISDYDVHRIAISRPLPDGSVDDGDRHQTLTYVRLKDLGEDVDGERAALAKAKFAIKKTAVYCLAARNLMPVGGMLSVRNPFAILRWNSREIGRTTPSRNDLNPEWEDPPVLATTTRDKPMRTCLLEIEVWDWNTTNNRALDFLGSVSLTGDRLISFFESKALLTLPLERSRRMTDAENQNVRGTLVLFGLLDDDIGKVAVPQDYRDDSEAVERARVAAEKAEKARLAEEKKAKGAGVMGSMTSMFGRKKATSTDEPNEGDQGVVEEKKRVTISSPGDSNGGAIQLPRIKFSQRHKISNPEQFGPITELEAPLVENLEEMGAEEEEVEGNIGDFAETPSEASGGSESGTLSGRGRVSLGDDLSLTHSATTGQHTFANNQSVNELYSLADRTMTDDSMTLAGITESRHITVKLLSAEGLPLGLVGEAVNCVVRFNGFFAAQVEARVGDSSITAFPRSPPRDEVGEFDQGYPQAPPEMTGRPSSPSSPARQRRQDNAGVAAFADSGILIHLSVPPFFELASCAVELEFWASASGSPDVAKAGDRRLLGRADIRGTRLVSFIETNKPRWLSLYTRDGAVATSPNKFDDPIEMRIQVIGDAPPPEPPKLPKIDLTIRSIRGLPFHAPDRDVSDAGSETGSKKSDDTDDKLAVGARLPSSLYVEVRFNDKVIGATPPQPDTYSPFPLWHDPEPGGAGINQFELVVPSDMTLDQCKLELRVFSIVAPEVKKGKKPKKNAKGKTTFHGSKVLEGKAILDFVEGAQRAGDRSPRSPRPLLDSGSHSPESASALGEQVDALSGAISRGEAVSGIATDNSTWLYSLHASSDFQASEAAMTQANKAAVASEREMLSTLLELRGMLGFVEADDWEMRNDVGGALFEEPPVLAPESANLGETQNLAQFNPNELMMERIVGVGGFTSTLPNTTLASSVVDNRPWSRLSAASRGRDDVPEGQRANAMSDTQDAPELRASLVLHKARLDVGKAVAKGKSLPKNITARVYFNERLVGDRSVSVIQPEKPKEKVSTQRQFSMMGLGRQSSTLGLGRQSSTLGLGRQSSTLGLGPRASVAAEEEDEDDDDDDDQADDSPIVIFIPRGQRLDACRLDVDLYQKSRYLGRTTIEGAQLAGLVGLERATAGANVAGAAGAIGLAGSMVSSGTAPVPQALESKRATTGSLVAGQHLERTSTASSPSASIELASPQGLEEQEQGLGQGQSPSSPGLAPTDDENAPPPDALEVFIKKLTEEGTGQRASKQGSLFVGCSMDAVELALAQEPSSGGALVQLGAAMHRRGQGETVRKVEIKLLATKGLLGGLQQLQSPRTGYGGNTSAGDTSAGAGGGPSLGSSHSHSRAGESGPTPAPGHAEAEAWAKAQSQDHLPASSVARGETVFAVVKWNGQEIRRSLPVKFGDEIVFKHTLDPSFSRESKTSGTVSDNTFTMFVPRGHRLRGCYLEVMLWDGGVFLGSTLLHGDDLTMFLEGYGSAPANIDFYSLFDDEDDATVLHRSFPLQYSNSVPQALQRPVNGCILLRGRVDPDPDPTVRAEVRAKGGGGAGRGPKAAYRKIRTALAPDTVGWAEHFGDDGGYFEQNVGAATGEGGGGARALLVGSALDQPSLQDAGGSLSGGAGAPPAFSMLGSSFVASLDKRSELFRTKLRVDMPAVTFRKRQAKNVAEDRICWRGRAMPAEVKGVSDAAKKSMFKNRASRIVRKGRTNDLRVMANVAYLEEVSGEAEAMQAALPVLVKEVVSDGPGVAQRVYRVEITTNSGSSLGFFDIANDEDIVRAVGADAAEIFGNQGRAHWNMPDIFAHIVNKRTSLDFAPPKRRGKDAGAKVSSMFGGLGNMLQGKKKEVVAPPLSVISCARDSSLDLAVLRYAMHGGELGGMTLVEIEAKKVDDHAQAKEMAKEMAFRDDLERRKNKAMEAERKAAAADLASRPTFHGGLSKSKHIDLKAVDASKEADKLKKQKPKDKGKGKAKSKDKEKKEGEAVAGGGAIPTAEIQPTSEAQSAASPAKKGGFGLNFGSLFGKKKEEPKVVINQLLKEQWIRLHNCVHNMSGVRFRTVIILKSRCDYFYDDPDRFFRQEPLETQNAMLRQCMVMIRAKDAFTAKVYELEFTGPELVDWVGDKFQYDLRKKYRRMLFGEFLVSKMIMRFSSTGELVVDLMTDDMGSAKSEDAVRLKLEKIRADAERAKREYEEAMAEALHEEIERERKILRESLEAQDDEEDEESVEEVQTSMFGNLSSAGDAAAAAAAAAKEAMMKAASDAKAAIGKMFSWGKK